MKQRISALNIEKYEKLLLYVLVELGADSEPVALSLERLVNLCSLSRRKVNENLKSLEERQLISVEIGKGKASNSYRVNL